MKNPRIVSGAINRSAFTLVELLVVMTILIGIMALAVVGVRDFGAGNELTGAAQNMKLRLGQARQLAATYNREVAFYAYKRDSSDPYYFATAMRLLPASEEPGEQAIINRASGSESNIDALPNRVVIPDDPGFSPILSSAENGLLQTVPGADLPPNTAEGVYFIIRPNGNVTTDTPATDSFFTIVPRNSSIVTGSGGPAPTNWATLSVNPVNGRVELWRP